MSEQKHEEHAATNFRGLTRTLAIVVALLTVVPYLMVKAFE